MKELFNSYIDTTDNPVERIKVQLILFTLGFNWGIEKGILEACGRYIYIPTSGKLLYNRTKVDFSPYCNYKEITLEEVYKL